MADSGTDPNALYEYGQTGIPSSFTQNLQGLGYVATPFAPQEDIFKNQVAFQHVLKSILDAQIGGFSPYGVGTNTAMLPYNLRNLFAGASTVMTDPTYGIIGAPGFFGGGYKMGDLPANRSSAYENWWQAAHGYPNVPAPQPLSSGGGGGGGANANQHVGSYTVPLAGGGSMTVNATSAAAAQQNANQGGNHPDTSQPVKTNRAASGY